jgi:hypothetical protein
LTLDESLARDDRELVQVVEALDVGGPQLLANPLQFLQWMPAPAAAGRQSHRDLVGPGLLAQELVEGLLNLQRCERNSQLM